MVNIDDQEEFKNSRGICFKILEKDDLRFIGHTGGQKGFISFFYIHPETKTAAIFIVNTLDISNNGISTTRKLFADIRDNLIDNIWPLFIE